MSLQIEYGRTNDLSDGGAFAVDYVSTHLLSSAPVGPDGPSRASRVPARLEPKASLHESCRTTKANMRLRRLRRTQASRAALRKPNILAQHVAADAEGSRPDQPAGSVVLGELKRMKPIHSREQRSVDTQKSDEASERND
jgi:hypothetical protein